MAICVDERAPWSWFPSRNNRLLFVRLDGGPGDSLVQDQVLESRFCRGDYFYSFNVPPARYAVVGSKNVDNPNKMYIFYEKDLVRQTAVTVAPGSFAFMGEFVVDTTLGFKEPEPVQQHYYHRSHPEGGGFDFMNPNDIVYGGYVRESRRDDKALDTGPGIFGALLKGTMREQMDDILGWAGVQKKDRTVMHGIHKK